MTDILERLRESAECADYVIDREVAYDASCAIKTLMESELQLLGQIKKLSEEMTQLRAALEAVESSEVYSFSITPERGPDVVVDGETRFVFEKDFIALLGIASSALDNAENE